MKKLAGLVVILAALVLGAYYGMGLVTERTVKHNLDVVNKSNGVFVNLVNYHRGWFTSTALLDWRLHIPEHNVKSAAGVSETIPAQDFDMRMPLTIYHGPVIMANNTIKFGLGYANTGIPLPDKYKTQFNEHFAAGSTLPNLDMSLFVNYLNTSQIELSIPDFKLIAKEGGEFEWQGMTSSMNVTSNANKINGEMDLNGIHVKKDDVDVVLSKVTGNYNLHQTDKGLYLGEVAFVCPSFVVNKKNEQFVDLTNFDTHFNSDIDQNLFSTHFKTTLEKLVVEGKIYGPGNLEIAVRNLDADVLASINQKASSLQQGTDLQKQQAILGLLPEIPKLFSRGAEFEIVELSFVMPEGKIEGNLLLSLPAGNAANPFELIQKIQGKGKLSVPGSLLKVLLNESNQQKLIKQQQQNANAPAPVTTVTQSVSTMTDAQINTMLQSGLLTQVGNDYVVEVALSQGQLQVNGKLFNPGMIKF